MLSVQLSPLSLNVFDSADIFEIKLILWDGMDYVSPTPNSYVEFLTLNELVFGDRPFKEIIEVE